MATEPQRLDGRRTADFDPMFRRPRAWGHAKDAFGKTPLTAQMVKLEEWVPTDCRHWLTVAIHHFLTLEPNDRFAAQMSYWAAHGCAFSRSWCEDRENERRVRHGS